MLPKPNGTQDPLREDCLRTLQGHVGGCREDLGPPTHDLCWQPAEYVLWGKLIPTEGLGPRCYEHARRHVSTHGLASRAKRASSSASLSPAGIGPASLRM